MIRATTRTILPLLFLPALFACTNQATDNAASDSGAVKSPPAVDTSTVADVKPADRSEYYIWDVNADEKSKTMNPQLREDYYSVDTLIMGLNEKYPQVKLEKKRMGHDTLYTLITDARYLTEQMGSAGSEQYIAQAVINLTSVKGINYVRIDFAEGSHAAPDVWSAASFNAYKTVHQLDR